MARETRTGIVCLGGGDLKCLQEGRVWETVGLCRSGLWIVSQLLWPRESEQVGKDRLHENRCQCSLECIVCKCLCQLVPF